MKFSNCCMIAVGEGRQDIEQNFHRGLGGVDHLDTLPIMVEHRFGFRFVGFKATLNHLLIGIVQAIVFERTFLEARKKLTSIRTGKVENFLHIDDFIHDPCLADVAGNPVEDEHIDIGLEFMRIDSGIDPRLPKLDRDFVRNEFSLARIFKEGAAHFGASVEGSKNITTGAMKKARDRADGTALGSFATTGGAKEKIRRVFHSK